MLKLTAFVLLIGLLFESGCGSGAPDSNMQGAASHGGVKFGFLDKTGSVELGTETAIASTPGASKQNPIQIYAYFYQADGTTPMATSPTGVKLLRGNLPPIPLSAQDLPGKTGRYASPPGPFLDELRGVLEATIEGKKVEVPFATR